MTVGSNQDMQETIASSEAVQSGIHRIVRALGAEVIEIVVRGNRREPVIEVFVDNETGVTIALCQEITQAVLDLLEAEAVPGNYRLTVSSPGVDRPLQFPWQYRKHVGRTVLLTLIDGTQRKGQIVAVDDAKLTLKDQRSRKEETIAFETIESGIIQIEFV